VLEHAYRRDAVESPVAYVTVVLQPDLDLSVQPDFRDPVASPLCLRRTERHTDNPRAVVLCRVDGQAAPSTTDVEDSLSGPVGQPDSNVSASDVKRAHEYVIAGPRTMA
jgi:hypothetical protein